MIAFRISVFLGVLLFFFSGRAGSETLNVDIDGEGFINLSGEGGVYLERFGVYPEGLSKRDFERKTSPESGGKRMTTVSYRLYKGEESCADVVTIVTETPDRVNVSYELRAGEDFTAGMNLAGEIPARRFVDKGMWYTIDEEDLLTKKEKLSFDLFPPGYRKTGDDTIVDGTPSHFGWFTDSGYGIKLKAKTPVVPRKRLPLRISDLRGTSRYAFRIELLTVFMMNDYIIHTGDFKKGEVVRWNITLEPFDRKQFAEIAFRHDEALVDIKTSFQQTSSGENTLYFEVLDLSAGARNIRFEYEVTDEIFTRLSGGELRLDLAPLERFKTEVNVPSYSRQNYRVFLRAIDTENKVSEEIKRTYKFDIKEALRPKFSLEGKWEVLPLQKEDKFSYPPPDKGWQWHYVPVIHNPFVPGWFPDNKKMWFRHKFDIPFELKERRVKLRFEDVREAGELWLNGKRVGIQDSGSSVPYTYDITDYIKPLENELCLAVHSESPYYGARIFGGVYLQGYNNVYAEDVFVQTSHRDKEMKLEISLINEDKTSHDMELLNIVYDKNGKVLEFPPQSVTVEAGGMRKVVSKKTWERPHLWMPDDPHLYNVVTIIKEKEKKLDEETTRFGFREVWRDGKDVILNGVPLGLFGISGVQHPLYMGPGRIYKPRTSPEEVSLQIQEAIHTLKENGVRIGRLWHGEGYEWLDECDEAGLLIEEESPWAYWGKEVNKIERPEYFQKWGEHIGRLIKRDRNHPSVIMWSMGNEALLFFHGVKDFIERHAALADDARKLDPTRLIVFEGGMDPLGKADIINLHYPHEFWTEYTLYPEEAYWLDEPIDLEAGFPPDNQNWFWEKDKPFYTGEAGANFFDPNSQSFFLGEEGLRLYSIDPHRAFVAGRKPFHRFQNEAWRYYGVGWTASAYFDEVRYFKDLYEPFYLFCREYNKTFYSKQRVKRTIHVINDFLEKEAGNFTLKWETSSGGKALENDEIEFSLPPHQIKTFLVEFLAPSVNVRKELLFEVSLFKEKVLLTSKKYNYSVFPVEKRIELSREIMLYEKGSKDKNTLKTGKVLSKLGLGYKIAELLRLNPERHILLIGEDSLDDVIEEASLKIAEFVKEGGRVICLQQEEQYPTWLPAAVKLSKEHSSTTCYIQDGSHPVISGLEPQDFKFWGGDDHTVARYEFEKPTIGNFRVIINSPSARRGLYWSSLLELPYGDGYYFLSQLNLTEKIAIEPVAREIFINLLKFADTASGRETVNTALLADRDGNLRETLDKIGCRYKSIVGKLARRELGKFGLMIVGGGEAVWDEFIQNSGKVTKFVQSGGKVLLHVLNPESAEKVRRILGTDLELTYYPATQLIKVSDDEAISGLSNYELYWPLGGPVADGVVERKRIIDYACLLKEKEGIKILTHPAALVKINRGRGFFLIDQTHWDTGTLTAPQPLKLASIILNNLGAESDVSTLGMVKRKKKIELPGGIWFFNGGAGSGNIVKDSTPNGNDAKIYGAVWKWDGGRVWALEFDGVDDYVEIADPLSRDISPTALDITEEITVEAWAKPYANTNHGPIAVKGSSIGFGPTYTYRIATRDDLTMTGGVCTPSTEHSFDVTAPELNEWHHYCITAEANGKINLYVDGKRVYQSPYNIKGELNPFQGYPIRVGVTYDDRFKYKGLVGELKLYGKVLSEKEIEDSHKAGSIKYRGR